MPSGLSLPTRLADHLYRLELLDGDTYIIHVSERELFQKAAGQWRRAYLMLSQADAQVVTFRRWLDTYGGAVPTCRPKGADAMGPVLPKEEVLDRFHQHTSSCTYCSTAVKALNVAIPLCKTLHTLTAAAAMAGLVLIAVAYRSVHHMHSMPPGAADPKTAAATTAVQVAMLLPHELRMAALVTAISAVLAATFFLVAFCLERWRTSYFYIGYDHTTRN